MSKSKRKKKSSSQSNSQANSQSNSNSNPQSSSKASAPPAKQKPAHGTLITIALVLVVLSNLFMTAVYWYTRRNTPNTPLVVTVLLIGIGG